MENYTVEVLRRLRAAGDSEAVVFEHRRISGTEAVRTILRFAEALRAMGLGEGEGVALFTENTPEALFLMLAIHYLGLRLVFVPPERGDAELAAFVRRAQVEMLLVDPAFRERAERMAVQRVYDIGPGFLRTAADRTDLTIDDAAASRRLTTVFYTGGTTGEPKLVTHGNGYYLDVTPARQGAARMLVATPITHTSGHIGSLRGLLTGAVVLLRTFDAAATLSVMGRERVTSVVVTTPMLDELLDQPGCDPGRFPALTSLIYGGVAPAPARLRQAIACFGPILTQVYGTTECGVVAVLPPQAHDPARPASLTSCGRPIPGVEVELRDGEGRVVEARQAGELWVRSRSVMTGYWGDPRATARVLDAGGWFRTGDLVRQDDDGYLYVLDRLRDVIVTGRAADNVYSRLLDDFLVAQPGIQEAATVGLAGAAGETVHVVLVVTDPPDLPELTRRIVDALGEIYRPASYRIVGSLPRTPLGKVDKRALRTLLTRPARPSARRRT
ncbi:AMP-binding protein [Actinoplanes sp. TBRC 11911]|uniref:class I adenylate-forming enzyme family protein n=1 Tax=Actinoplanes sp. TBRC 11911 TaxID=2729386 RepID=UPI00145D53F8|nr:AMP-binding protein [Actinoplanes sp. TBRC 11911]NMO55515.1 AMP-binding protein [Actinoplanes sp. TBRC 11911]